MAQKLPQPMINFVGGEVSPTMLERADIETFLKSMARAENFVVLPQGGLKGRPGSYNIGLTKSLNTASLIPFQFSANDALMIVATQGVFRYYRSDSVVLNTATNISAATKANPCQVTSTAHGLVTGQEVFVTGVSGMTRLNGRFFLVVRVDADHFTLQDQWGTNVDSTGYGTYTSGGTVASIYETTTPYQSADLLAIRGAQVGDLMYLVCNNQDNGDSYLPQKLVRNGFTKWTLGAYPRKNDPFPVMAHTVFTVTAITKGVTTTVHVSSAVGLSNGTVLRALNIGGMTDINGAFFQIAALNTVAKTFVLQDSDGTNIDSTAFGTFTSGGTFTLYTRNPGCAAFSSDGRLVLASTEQNPEGYWASELPTGFLTNYDNFTLNKGTAQNPALGMAFSFSPVNNELDTIREIAQFGSNFALLGASSIRLIYGAQLDQPPTPIAINTRPTIQGSAKVRPLVINYDLVFVDVNQQKLRGLQFNLAYDTFQAKDFNLSSPHLGQESNFIKLAMKKGTPDTVLCLRADGVLLACTFDNIENISGWTRIIPALNGQILDIATIRTATGTDELWMIVQRTMNGKSYCTVEVLDIWPVFSSLDNFFTGNETADKASWASAAWESGKQTTFLDASITYSGTARGIAANANLTITSGDPTVIGNTVTITASAGVFQAADVNAAQVWKSYTTAGTFPLSVTGGGRALITSFISATQVQAYIQAPFDTSAQMNSGAWSFAVQTLNNLDVYNGLSVNIQADGGELPATTVANGSITLPIFASVVQVGFGFTARAILPDPTVLGARARFRTNGNMSAKLLDSVGGQIGASPYNLTTLKTNKASGIQDRVPAPFSGTIELPQLSDWGRSNQRPTIVHAEPTPFTLLYLEYDGLVAET